MKKQILILILFLFLCLLTFSQPDPGGNPSGEQNPIGSGVPLDGGLIALFAAGAAYGTKKLYKKRNDKK
ncbi:MAG: hypothetical protein B6I24_10345 [Bacteroidetes bacterium 4572_128]|nr:MAG: hypothetical protein B6I24_10345 [Bacteroidetes bacterium 4572_128]